MEKESRRRYPVARVKGCWTAEEDVTLKSLVASMGEGNWSNIAKALNDELKKDPEDGRIGKQCRERYSHHLHPALKKDAWNKEEEQMLVQAHRQFGNRWSEIARLIPGRSENSVKNHWNATLRRKENSYSIAASTTVLRSYMEELQLLPPSQTSKAKHIPKESPQKLQQQQARLFPLMIGSSSFYDLGLGSLSAAFLNSNSPRVHPYSPSVDQLQAPTISRSHPELVHGNSLIKDEDYNNNKALFAGYVSKRPRTSSLAHNQQMTDTPEMDCMVAMRHRMLLGRRASVIMESRRANASSELNSNSSTSEFAEIEGGHIAREDPADKQDDIVAEMQAAQTILALAALR